VCSSLLCMSFVVGEMMYSIAKCWSYFRLNIGRPRLSHYPIHDRFPFVCRWKGKHTGPTANRDVTFYRKSLDSLKPSEVDWCPYIHIKDALLPNHIRGSLILGRSNTMLIWFDKAERHLPDRCLRQFGIRQPIPLDV
nr:protein MAIN-LIKE 2 [Tanacetum cinerariifolium]